MTVRNYILLDVGIYHGPVFPICSPDRGVIGDPYNARNTLVTEPHHIYKEASCVN